MVKICLNHSIITSLALLFFNIYDKIFSEKIKTEENTLSSFWEKRHCVKSIQILSFFWSVLSCIRTEYRKIRTRKYSVFGHFSRSARNRLTRGLKDKREGFYRKAFGRARCPENFFKKVCGAESSLFSSSIISKLYLVGIFWLCKRMLLRLTENSFLESCYSNTFSLYLFFYFFL